MISQSWFYCSQNSSVFFFISHCVSCFRCLSLLHWDQENILLSFRTFLIAFHIYNPTRVYFFVYMAWEESSFFSFLSLFSLRIFNWPNIYHSFPTALQYNLCCKSKILFQGFYSIPSAYRTICKSFKISLDTWENKSFHFIAPTLTRSYEFALGGLLFLYIF